MEPIHGLFLEALRAALENRTVTWGAEVPPEDMDRVLTLAEEHHVLPMVFQAVYACPAAAAMDGVLFTKCRRATIQTVTTQAMKTEEFLRLNRHLRDSGIRVLVVKGIICRNLYPDPDCRFSGDEDVLCAQEQFRDCHKAMIDFGMEPSGPNLEAYEVPYRTEDGLLYIELHKSLFPRELDVFSDCNLLFEDAFQRSVEITVRGEPVATLGYTDHLLFLILHAFKHFLHSGFGIRQVCDMVMFANAYGEQVDWEYILDKCKPLRAEKFAAALFRIGEKYLGFSPEKAGISPSWRQIQVDEQALLEDLLCGGIYGSTDRSRLHSSNMTLNAVAADKKGKKSRGNVLRTVFPPAKYLEVRFPYLQRRPYLLPVAWCSRIFDYARETMAEPAGGAAHVIRTGSQRIELLREYGIID